MSNEQPTTDTISQYFKGIQRLAISIHGVESLNAAVAAGIVCYETARRSQ